MSYFKPERTPRREVIPVGDLNQPIVFFTSSRVPNETTGFVTTLTKYGNGWAKVEEREVKWLNGAQCDPFTGHRFTIRNVEGLITQINVVVVWGSRVFRVDRIKHPDHDRERRFLVLICREDVSLTSPDFQDPTKVTIVTEGETLTETTPTTSNEYW